MKKRTLLLVVLFVQITTFLLAQNIGLLTTTPDAPVHIASSGQVNYPGGLMMLGARSEGHLEMDFNLLQSKYGVVPLSLSLQPEGGMVGINTLFPSAPFHVASSGQVNTPGGLMLLGYNQEGHLEMDFDRIQANYGATSSLPLKIQPDGGYVGINASLPSAPLHVYSIGIGSTTGGLFLLGNRNAGHLEMDFDLIQSRFINNFSVFRIQPAGGNINLCNGDAYLDAINNRFGLLDNTPSYTLDVNGQIGLFDYLYHKGDDDTYLRFLDNTINLTAGAKDLVKINGTQNNVILGSNTNANVQIASTVFAYEASKSARIGASGVPGATLDVIGGSTNNLFRVARNSEEKMRITQTGNIILGNTNPTDTSNVKSYFPVKIDVTGFSEVEALDLNGPGMYMFEGGIDAGVLTIRSPAYGYSGAIKLDGEGIQAINRDFFDWPETLKLNDRGGDVTIGALGNYSRLGINSGYHPVSDLEISQGSGGNATKGITLEEDGYTWQMMFNTANMRMEYYFDGTLKAGISHTDGSWITSSDRALKKNIEPITATLNEIIRLNPVQYHMKDQVDTTAKCIGFIAQEVQEVFPGLVTQAAGNLALNYDQFAVLAIQAVKELNQQNAVQGQRIAMLENQVNEMNEKLNRIEALVKKDSH